MKNGKTLKEELKNINNFLGLSSSIGIIILSLVLLWDYTFKGCGSSDLFRQKMKDDPDSIDWNVIRAWGFIILLKIQKVVTFLGRLKQIGLTLSIFYHLMPFLKDLGGMVMIIFFMFATIGINLFGGHVNSGTEELHNRKIGGMGTKYDRVNFNDFPNAIFMLFVNVIGNNWIFFCNINILSEDDSRVG